jgi:uncharacterized RDD family membrane protein YckC
MSDVEGVGPSPGGDPPPPTGYPPPPPPPPPGFYGPPPTAPPSYGWAQGSGGSPTPSGPPALADYGSRLGGWLIDWVLLAVIAIPILLLTGSFHHSHIVFSSNAGYTDQYGFNLGPLAISLQAIVVIAYGAIFCGAPRGQTLGMMVVRTKVIDEATGGPIGYLRGLGRAAFEYLMAVALFIPWVIDMLFPLWDPKRQTLHDKVTRAVVVKI